MRGYLISLKKRHTNAVAELFNANLKGFRKTFRGLVDMKIFLFQSN
jgi:hypothetical protein